VVAEVDVRLEAGDTLAGDAGALEAANQLFGFARKHGTGDDFENAGDRGGLLHVGANRKRTRAVDKVGR